MKRIEEVEWSSLTFRDWTVNSWHVSQFIPFLQGDQLPSYVIESSASQLEGMLVKKRQKSTDTTTGFFFDCLFLVTELFLWITVLVILLYFCQRCSVSRGAHKDLTMFRLSCVQVIIIFDRLHLIFRSSSESCCVFPPPKCTLVLNNVSSHWIPVISYFVLQLLITWFECK